MNTSDSSGFSGRLRAQIERTGIKQTALAKAAGVTPQTLSRYLREDRVPHESVIRCFADRLGVTVSYLMGDSKEAAPRPVVAKETESVYIPDAVALTGLDDEERRTVIRLLDALRSGDADIRRHLIGQLKIIETAVRYRQQQSRSVGKDTA